MSALCYLDPALSPFPGSRVDSFDGYALKLLHKRWAKRERTIRLQERLYHIGRKIKLPKAILDLEFGYPSFIR